MSSKKDARKILREVELGGRVPSGSSGAQQGLLIKCGQGKLLVEVNVMNYKALRFAGGWLFAALYARSSELK